MSRKKWLFEITSFCPKTKEILLFEKLRTKPMSAHDFKKLLKKELKDRTNYCWKVSE